ncbi:MAG: NADPH-dependent F420 reductase [Chloroflexota bacterium]
MTRHTIAILGGTGDQGFGLALRLALAGHEITIGSREAGRADEAAERARAMLAGRRGAAVEGSAALRVRGAENAAAAREAEVVIVTVPFSAQAATLKAIKGSMHAGQVLVDVTVPLAASVGGRATRILGVPQGSAAQQAAELVPQGVSVVGAWHNVSAEALSDLDAEIDCDVLLCGDNAAAKDTVRTLVAALPGARAVDAGPLENARIVESITALLVAINIRHKVHRSGIRITGLPA